MTGPERGFLLLCSHLGDPNRPVLTTAQFRTLASRMQQMEDPKEDRLLREEDLVKLGYTGAFSHRVVGLLQEEDLLDHCLRRAEKQGCIPIPRIGEHYPLILRQRLGLDSPGCFWAKGDISLLQTPAISLVGSRELKPENKAFAQALGTHAANQGLTLVSGNARGADRTAQDACLLAGGKVISIVADDLSKHPVRERVLYLSEEDFDAEFSAQRALSRNRSIHALGQMVFVAQADLHRGGTWDGTVKNLQFGWSPVLCFRDGSPASRELEQMGAYLLDSEDLQEILDAPSREITFFQEGNL